MLQAAFKGISVAERRIAAGISTHALQQFGRRFFLFAIGISAWNIFSSDNWGRAAGKEALTLAIDVGATALGIATVVVFGGPAVLAIVAGAAVGLAASFAFDGWVDDLLDFATGEMAGPIVSNA